MTDDGAGLTATIAKAATTLAPRGFLNAATPIVIKDKTGFTLDLTGAVIRGNATSKRPVIEVDGGEDITIIAPTIDGLATGLSADGGYNSTFEAQHGIAFYGTQGAAVRGGTISRVRGDVISINRAKDNPTDIRRPSFDVTIAGVTGHHVGRHGLSILGGEKVRIVNNFIYETARAWLDMEPATADTGAHDVTVEGNWCGRSKLLWIAARGKIGDVSGVTVRGNLILGDNMDIWIGDIDGARRTDWRIEGNWATRPEGNDFHAIIRAWNVDNLGVVGNVQPCSLRDGVQMRFAALDGCPGALVTGNVMSTVDPRTGQTVDHSAGQVLAV